VLIRGENEAREEMFILIFEHQNKSELVRRIHANSI